jgi:phospholipid/cholesterol/gamma-HCH transport system ATP-binding protein
MSTQEPTIPAGSKGKNKAGQPNQAGNGMAPQASSGKPGAQQPAIATAKPVAAPSPPPAPSRSPGSPPRAGERPASQSESTWSKDPVVELVDVHKAFGSLRVLDGVTCRVPRGEITVLMGPSGTGKSVMLRHIVGLLPPDKGDVYVDGKDVPHLNERDLLRLRRGIGMLFQDGALFSSMNLYDNVAFPLRQHTRKNEGGIREIVMEHLAEVGLAGAEKRMPNELSGGMRKRAGFARALVMEPRILLFDEPDSGLDPVRTTLLCDLIREISQKYEATSIVVSHDVGAVRRFADNIGILYKGKMRHFGTKHEIEVSDDEFVHQFFNASSEGPLGMD